MCIIFLLIVYASSKHTFANDTNVKILNNELFHQMNIGRDDHSWFILFYRPSCPHCQKVLPVWDELANVNQTHSKIGAVNCEIEKELCKLFSISGVPTMILISNQGILHHYSGNRTKESFIEFVDNNWQKNDSETPPEDEGFDLTIIFVLLFLSLVGFLIWIFFEERKSYQKVDEKESMIEIQDLNKQIEI